MSGTVCCYSGCKKSYSTDKDVAFFKFPDDPKRRKKWMQSCGNLELENLQERQLRGKRICSDHFPTKAFVRPESRTALTDSAVPLPAKSVASPATPKVVTEPVAVKKTKQGAAASPTTPSNKKRKQEPPDSQPAKKPEPVNVPEVSKSGSDGSETTKPASNLKIQKTPSSSETVVEAPSSKTQKLPETGAVCCYSGCKKSYSTDKDVTYFQFPDDPKRRKEWMQSCGLENLQERQLRGKRICSDHFPPKAFLRPESKTALTDSAVPLTAKSPPSPATPKVTTEPVAAKKSKPEAAATPSTTSTKKRKQELSTSQPVKKPEPENVPEVAKSGSDGSEATKPSSDLKIQKSPSSEAVVDGPSSKIQKLSETGAVCCYAGCKKSYSTDKNVAFFQFPDDPKRRKEWMQSCGLENLQERQLRGKRICSDHFLPKAFLDPKSKTTLTNSAVPLTAKSLPSPATPKVATEPVAAKKSKPEAAPSPSTPTKKRKQEPPTLQPAKMPEPVNVPEVAKSGSESSEPTKPTSNLKKQKTPSNSEGVVATPTSKPKQGAAASPSTPSTKKRKQKTLVSTPIKKPKPAILSEVSKSRSAGSESTKPTSNLKMQKTNIKREAIVEASSSKTPKLGLCQEIIEKQPKIAIVHENADQESEPDSYDDYMFLDESFAEDESETRANREFERFYASLKKFLQLSGKWTMGGVQWDPLGKRKVIIVSEPEIPPSGRPCVKRCLQFFEDKSIRVFIDGLDMTDVFGMTCYAEKEDVASLIYRVADASSCCGVPEMVSDDVTSFPNAKKRNTAYYDAECPGIIPNDSDEAICISCKKLRDLVMESREKERQRLLKRGMMSQEKQFQHPFGKALYTMFSDLVDETDPTKPRKKRNKETFFRKFLTDTRYKMNGGVGRTERIYVEKPVSVDSVSASFQDIVSKLGFCMPNAQKNKSSGSSALRTSAPSSSGTTPRTRPPTSTNAKVERKQPMQVEHILPFTPGSSFTLDDGQEYELIGEVDAATTEFVEMKPTPSQQYEIIEVDDETLAKLASAKNSSVVMLPEAASAPPNVQVTRIDANDPNLSQILKAINTSHGFKVT